MTAPESVRRNRSTLRLLVFVAVAAGLAGIGGCLLALTAVPA